MRTAPTVGPKSPLLSRPRVTAGLAVGLCARVHPTGKVPPLAPLGENQLAPGPIFFYEKKKLKGPSMVLLVEFVVLAWAKHTIPPSLSLSNSRKSKKN